MRGPLVVFMASSFLLLGIQGTAQAQHRDGTLALGAQIGLGMQWSARNSDMKDNMQGVMVAGSGVEDITNSAGFSGGGWLFADYYLSNMLALEAGLGFVSKGTHWKTTASVLNFSQDIDIWYKLAYMEIPLGVKLDISRFRVTALLLLNIALSGKTKAESGGDEQESEWEDEAWDDWRRFNIGMRLGVGYAIPVGPIVIVPGVDWSTHFINELDIEDSDAGLRLMNFFFNVGVEYGI